MATRNITTKIQMRRDTATNWETKNPILTAGEIGFDTTNKQTKIGDGTTAWFDLDWFATKPKPTFADSDWATITEVAAAGKAQNYFAVGDDKNILLSTGEEITITILGFNHDDLTSGGKAPITIGMKNLLATKYPMNSTNTNAGGWNNSVMRSSTMATLLSQLPSDLQSAIKQVNKLASAGSSSATITTSADKLFLFSEVEIDATTTAVYAQEGVQYEYWQTIKDGKISADRIKYLSNGGGSAYTWWLRSPYAGNSSLFRYILSSGDVGNSVASIAYGVSFGFCV